MLTPDHDLPRAQGLAGGVLLADAYERLGRDDDAFKAKYPDHDNMSKLLIAPPMSSPASSSSPHPSPLIAPRPITLPALSPISDLEIDVEFTGSLRRRPSHASSSTSPSASDDADPEVDELDPSHHGYPATETVAARKASHNAVERARRDKLNARILQLGALLPSLSGVRRPSRLAITKSSIAHVHLARRHRLLAMTQLRRMAGEHAAIVDEVNRWRARAGIPLLPRGDPERGLRAMQALDNEIMEPVAPMSEEEFDERFSAAAFEQTDPAHAYPHPKNAAKRRKASSQGSPQRFTYLPPATSFDFPDVAVYPSPPASASRSVPPGYSPPAGLQLQVGPPPFKTEPSAPGWW
ncbi:BHLH domain-containing protein [Mycena chlorophos]|uniref:BHLH domain-containing protein n=1 Tax=Mycena chlorophos TaxID=658473 RepID=A0A8H6S0X6_MYCCL|nr:BHLH domain-containing protein [Mycena chlorophos]